ncbi:MAG TPA: AsmA-like C-terminal region-containing protein [Tepidisphaeraceae bacterium]|nr:AsmA-like C-terminal region-containing protein [Tepidisphaeraceae bacterium]
MRRLRWAGVAIGVLGVVVYVILPLIVTPMIRARLQKQISTQLNAELKMGSVSYWFPYGVTVVDAVLVAKDQQGEAVELLRIPRLKLALARLPFHEGPLVIRKLILEKPAIHLIDSEQGIVGRRSLVKADASATQPTIPDRWQKLSEMFELRRVTIKDAQIIYEDRESPETVPAAWRNIDIDLTTTPAANPLYQFNFTAINGTLAELHAAGSFNVDSLELVVAQITSKLNLKAGQKESPIPANLQRLLLDNNMSGNFAIAGTARAPLRKMEEAAFDVHVSLSDGAARIARWQSEKDTDQTTFDRIVGKFHCSSEPLTEDQGLMATAGDLRAAVTRPGTRPTTAVAKNRKMPAAYLLVEEAEIVMGDNLLRVTNAAAAYDRRLREWQIKQARGTLTLGKHKEELPKPIRAATEKPQFFGVVDITLDGQGSMIKPRGAGARRPFQINLKVRCPELMMTPRRLVATNVSCNMLITPGLVQFVDEDPQHRAISANLYGGSLIGHGAIRTGKPTHYDMAGSITDVDLRAFARDWTRNEEKLSKLSGRAFATVQLSGATSHGGHRALDLITGEGVFEILDGEFYELPILSDIASAISVSKGAAEVGQAAGRFKVEHREIEFKRIAVAAPVLGVQGAGKATFDGELDFKLVAAPLADWKKQLQKSNIPLLDSVGAELFGGIQKLLNTATGKLLYQFKISGTATKPSITPEAVPILTEDGMKLLKDMLKGTGRLLDQM